MEMIKNAVFATVIGFILYFLFGIGFIFELFSKISQEPETLRVLIVLLISTIVSGRLQK